MNPQTVKTNWNERGALMIEAIALLGLMTMMSPMVVRQTADRTAEMEEVAVAGQMKELKDALSNWIEAHYQERKSAFANSNTLDTHFTVNASQLAEYLSANYLDGANFRGNKLADGFDIGVRAQCTEASKTDGSECVAGTCYTLTNGAVTSIADTGTTRCSRYKMTGLVLSRSDSEIDDRRASRIASMIGADGGYMRTSTLVNAMTSDRTNEMKKIMGAQGIWEGNVDNFFTGMSTARGGRVAATTIYSSGFSGDYLYRKKVDGLPGANSMFTDLDMGGATECNADGCHKINNAGGLEVVGGKILIRSRNGSAANDADVRSPGNSDYARIALATDESHMMVNNSITLNIANVNPGYTNPASFMMNQSAMNLTVRNPGAGGTVNIGTGFVSLSGGAGSAGSSTLNVTPLNISARTPQARFQMNGGTAGGNIFLGTQSGGIDLEAYRGAINIDAQYSYLNMRGDSGVDLWSDYDTEIGAVMNVNVTAGQGFMSHISGTNTSVNMYSGRIRQKTTTTQINMSDSNKSIELKVDNSNVGTSGSPASGLILDNTGLSGWLPRTSSEKVTFALNSQGLDIALGNHAAGAATLRRLFYQNNGLVLYTADGGYYANNRLIRGGHRIDFTYGNNTRLASIVASQGSNPNAGGAVSVVAGGVTENNPLISLYGNTGRVSGVYFQPERMAYNGTVSNMVLQRVTTSISENGIQTGAVLSASDGTVPGSNLGGVFVTPRDALVIYNSGYENGSYKPYGSHNSDDSSKYRRFRVDPAFISVMNDIKVTSRGGARLSEALPNYILKGIYEMTNSYGAGGWPCTSGTTSSCTWYVPKFTKDELFLSATSPEFSCAVESGDHPIRNGGGYCHDDSDGYVEFSLNRNNGGATYSDDCYFECVDDDCWAHPYMGTVPAPGRKITEKDQNGTVHTLAAQDEGVCPDGYQAVMTLTPTSFDVGRVSYINPNYDITSAKVAYNAGWQNYKNESNRRASGIMQAATRIGIYTLPVVDTGILYGWKIAMGTITPYGGSGGYIWNAGGVSANSMGAIAHTYCYFNPQRFNMPNMRFMNANGGAMDRGGADSILTPMDNPMIGNGSVGDGLMD